MVAHDPARTPLDHMITDVARTVHDERVLRALRDVPRDRFVPERARAFAYEDTALPIDEGQTIFQHTIVGMMTEALQLTGRERVLEIGTVEVIDALREEAKARLSALGLRNVRCLPAGEELGAPFDAPFDAIVVTAAAAEVPPPLIQQLRVGGRMVVPVGSRFAQDLLVVTRTGAEGGFTRRSLGPCAFVPLVGPYGFVEQRAAPPRAQSELADLKRLLRSDDCETVAAAAGELAAARVQLDRDDLGAVRCCIRSTSDPGRRMRLVRDYITVLGPAAGAGVAVELLRHGNAIEREAALEAAIDVGERALKPLGELAREDDARRRWFAYEAIRLIGGPDAIPLLIDGLEDEDFSNRWAASHGLIDAGERAYRPVLHAIVERRPSRPFHRAALRVLRRTSPPAAEHEAEALLVSLDSGTSEVASGPLAFELLYRLKE